MSFSSYLLGDNFSIFEKFWPPLDSKSQRGLWPRSYTYIALLRARRLQVNPLFFTRQTKKSAVIFPTKKEEFHPKPVNARWIFIQLKIFKETKNLIFHESQYYTMNNELNNFQIRSWSLDLKFFPHYPLWKLKNCLKTYYVTLAKLF